MAAHRLLGGQVDGWGANRHETAHRATIFWKRLPLNRRTVIVTGTSGSTALKSHWRHDSCQTI
jgi:hypothetical protein